jgi:hypothetical protein
VSSANCSSSEFSTSDKDSYDVRCRDKTYRDSKLGTDSECAEQEVDVRTQEDEARGTDELDEGYLTRGGADEASWPAPQQAQQQAVASAPDNGGISSSGIIGADGDVPESFVTENAPPFPPDPPPGPPAAPPLAASSQVTPTPTLTLALTLTLTLAITLTLSLGLSLTLTRPGSPRGRVRARRSSTARGASPPTRPRTSSTTSSAAAATTRRRRRRRRRRTRRQRRRRRRCRR